MLSFLCICPLSKTFLITSISAVAAPYATPAGANCLATSADCLATAGADCLATDPYATPYYALLAQWNVARGCLMV